MNCRPKILYVTSVWPLKPAHSGARQRVLNIGRLLGRFGEVSLVIAEFGPADEDTVRRTRREFNVRKIVRPLPAGRDDRLGRVEHRLRYEFDPRYLATHHYTVAENDRSALLELIKEHDLVWVHTVRTANLFRIDRWPRSVLDVDDIPSRFYLSKARSCRNPARRFLDLRLSWMWRLRERRLTERFGVLTVCSEDDQRSLGSPAQVHVIPNGFHTLAMRPRIRPAAPRIGFIGSVKYQPNAEGMKWFIRGIWPLIKHEIPDAQLRLVGLGTDGYSAALGPDIVGLGWLEDPGDEIASWSTMIVPITFGGGTRVKIAEGFARRCPVVSTTVGAFGYDVHNGEEILLADAAEDFSAACVRLLTTPQLQDTLAEKAYTRFLGQWTWDSFEGSMGAVLQASMTQSGWSG